MPRRTADLISVAVVTLWVGLLLRGLPPAFRMMDANDLLTPVSNMLGVAVAGTIFVGSAYGVGLVIGLLAGNAQAQMWAVFVGAATSFLGASFVTGGLSQNMLSHPWSAAYFLAACVGGPLLVVVGLLGGINWGGVFPIHGRRPWPARAGSTPAPPTTSAPSTVPSSPLPVDDGGYWARSAPRTGPATPPLSPPSPEARREPFWTDLSPLGWVAFAVLAGAVGLGAVWIGGRWHRGDHPLLGAMLVGTALGIAYWWDRRRRGSS